MAITLDELIKVVQASADDDLTRLEAAAQQARQLGELGDSLLSHFVDRARRSGRTWAEIGEHLGVTRQAVQKRFVDTAGASIGTTRFTLRAKNALHAAGDAARELQHSYIGTEHILLGLLDDRGEGESPGAGIGGQVLGSLGVTRELVVAGIEEVVGRGLTAVLGQPPLTPRAAKVLEEAINASLDLGHNYQGTEHLLLGLYRGQDGLAKQLLERHGATREKVLTAVVQALAGYDTSKKDA